VSVAATVLSAAAGREGFGSQIYLDRESNFYKITINFRQAEEYKTNL
jgi:hypothetical protein